MNSLYPLKFKPLFKSKIWGGNKIQKTFNLDTNNMPNCGEAWLLSGVEGENTLVTNGYLAENELNELITIYMGDLVGDQVFDKFGEEFPILVKILDANDWLSIQVHPDDELAKRRGMEMGKTEMWYTIQADPDAKLISGFSEKVDKETYLHYLNKQALPEILNEEKVNAGDAFFIPAGRVHALGPGCLIAEIQQTSDTTYRLYDYDRIGVDGLKRELHTADAMDAIDFSVEKDYKIQYEAKKNKTIELVDSAFFTTELIDLEGKLKKEYDELDSFVLYLCLEGSFDLHYDDDKIQVTAGETILVPNCIESIFLESLPSAKLLEVYMKN